MNPVLDPEFWRERLRVALRHDDPRRAVFKISDPSIWDSIDDAHARILATHVDLADSVLDVGCGYGRLLANMPAAWRGQYLGIDLSPDFINFARGMFLQREFLCGDFRTVDVPGVWDLGVFCSVRGMLLREAPGVWEGLLARATEKCRKVLVLELDCRDPGTIVRGNVS